MRGSDRRASAASICSAISRSEAFADALRYRLRQIDVDGTEHVSSEIVVTRIGIDVLELRPSFPNPARERFTVQVSVPEATETARLVLYDLLGRPVRSIDALMPGRHELRVNASGVAVTLAAVVPSSGPLRKGNRRLIDEGATPLPGRSALEAFLGDMPVA